MRHDHTAFSHSPAPFVSGQPFHLTSRDWSSMQRNGHGILHALRNGEIARPGVPRTSALMKERSDVVAPNTTVADVSGCQDLVLRKFVCGGKVRSLAARPNIDANDVFQYLLCFSTNMTEVILFRFRGLPKECGDDGSVTNARFDDFSSGFSRCLLPCSGNICAPIFFSYSRPSICTHLLWAFQFNG